MRFIHLVISGVSRALPTLKSILSCFFVAGCSRHPYEFRTDFELVTHREMTPFTGLPFTSVTARGILYSIECWFVYLLNDSFSRVARQAHFIRVWRSNCCSICVMK